MRALILAAGLGTRLKPFTDEHPKALLPLAGKTLLEWQVEKLHAAGIYDIIVNVHHHADELEAFIHSHWPEIQISDERDMLLETGGAIRKCKVERGESSVECKDDLLVVNVDILSNIDIRELIAAHRPENLATLVVSERKTQRYFVFENETSYENENENERNETDITDKTDITNLRMVGWANVATGETKPAGLEIEGKRLLAFSGMHIVSAKAIEQMQSWPEKFSITDYYIHECNNGHIVAYVPADYKMMDVGKTDQLAEAEAFGKSLVSL